MPGARDPGPVQACPAEAWGKPYTPPPGTVDPSIAMKTAVREQVEGMDTVSFLTLLATLMKQNPPYAEDAPVLARFQRIGLVAGQDFDSSKIASAPGIQDVPKLAVERIEGHFQSGGEDLNGWLFIKPGGRYETDYLQRAFVTRVGLGCNLTEDAVYPSTVTDASGAKLDGANKYVLRFAGGADATSARLLVVDDVYRAIFLRRQSAEPLYAECAQRTESRSGRHD